MRPVKNIFNKSRFKYSKSIKSNSILFVIIFIFSLITGPSVINAEPSVPFVIPLDGEIIVSFRQEYLYSEKETYLRHTGIDIRGNNGQKVIAAGNGVVSYCGFSPIGGRTIVIRHNKKIRTTYLNLTNIYVTVGSYVNQGDIIASIGAADDPSSPLSHLHFGVIYDGKYLDPAGLFEIDYRSISRFLYIRHLKPDFNLDY